MQTVVQQSTDEHGWQYRSHWPKFVLESEDEPWSNHNSPTADVRRRLWMTTVVKKDDNLAAKKKISELVASRDRGVILSGPLLRLEENKDGTKSWVVRKATLVDDKILLYDDETNQKLTDLPILGRQIKMLEGFAFSIRRHDGASCEIFDTDSKETRRRWLVGISYQIAICSPLVDFSPFPYAPPIGEDNLTRTVICGTLAKRGQSGFNWKNRFFRLSPRELQYYDQEMLKGTIKIDGATLYINDHTSDITIKATSGSSMVVRAPTADVKSTWVDAMEIQINMLEQKAINAARPISAEEWRLTMVDADGGVEGLIVIPSVALLEEESEHAQEATPPSPHIDQGYSHPLRSAFSTSLPDTNAADFLQLPPTQQLVTVESKAVLVEGGNGESKKKRHKFLREESVRVDHVQEFQDDDDDEEDDDSTRKTTDTLDEEDEEEEEEDDNEEETKGVGKPEDASKVMRAKESGTC